jgi:hypothetical protein
MGRCNSKELQEIEFVPNPAEGKARNAFAPRSYIARWTGR